MKYVEMKLMNVLVCAFKNCATTVHADCRWSLD